MSKTALNLSILLELSQFVICPNCSGKVSVAADEILCADCGRKYPIIDGIPRFVELGAGVPTRRAFSLKWSKYETGVHPLWSNWIRGEYSAITYELPVTESEYQLWRRFLLDSLSVDEQYFNGKAILDAGCGVGWVSYTVSRLGGTVISADLSDSSVWLTSRVLDNPNSKVMQADLTRLPFRHGCFDAVISLGVLHHTNNTRSSFLSLAKTVKQGGDLFIHVYEKTNPIKEALTEFVRRVIHVFSEDTQFRICKDLLTADFKFLLNNPAKRKFYRLLNILVMIGASPDDTFDVYSPRYNHRHTFDEVENWFKEAGFQDIKNMNDYYNVGNKRMLHPGALWVSGRKA